MFFPAVSSSVFFLASSILVDAAGYATHEPGNPACQGFNVHTNETMPLVDRNLIISSGVVCNVRGSNYSTSCDVLSGGFPVPVPVVYLMNGTKVGIEEVAIGYGVWNATDDINLLYGGYGLVVENRTVHFENGTSGYVAFTPIYRCITGTIQGCPSDFSLANDTQVRGCYPENTGRVVSFESYPGHFENIGVLAGNRSINYTSIRVAANLKKNPEDNPPYGLSSSGVDAPVKLTGVGISIALFLTLSWFGVWLL